MEQDASRDTGHTLADLVEAAGIVVTDEGRARARRKLDAAAARMTPDKWASLRAQFGRPSATA
jgi:hypothetical protein